MMKYWERGDSSQHQDENYASLNDPHECFKISSSGKNLLPETRIVVDDSTVIIAPCYG